MNTTGHDIENLRLIARVLTLHYEDGLLQSQIATDLGLSTAKVNRLIKQGRESGMVKISIETPFQRQFDLERQLKHRWNLKNCLVVPTVSGNEDATLNQVGRGAAQLLVEAVRDGDTIGVSAGKTMKAVSENIVVDRHFDVDVVPMAGGVQGRHYTDVNHIATELADKLGGRATLIHAPLHVDTTEERDLLMSVRSVRGVLDLARKAAASIVGIGSVIGPKATYYEAHPVSQADKEKLLESGVRGELLGRLINGDGSSSAIEFNAHLVALTPEDAGRIPVRIGAASGPEKVGAIAAVLNGGHINMLVVDELTAAAVLEDEVDGA